MTLAIAVLTLVTLARLGELLQARRNTARLRAAGAREYGRCHYPAIVMLHAAWLAGLWLFASHRAVIWPWLAIYICLQGLRAWVLTTLGPRWTTRIIVLPEAPLVRSGPYRFLSHPNYAIVVGEIAALPLAFGLVCYALVFSILNAAMLAIRVRAENAALASASHERAR